MLGWFKKKFDKNTQDTSEQKQVNETVGTVLEKPSPVHDIPKEEIQGTAKTKTSREDVEETDKKSLFSRLSHRLANTRSTFNYQLDNLFLGKKEIDSDLLDDLEEILITADLGVGTTQELLEYTRRKVKRKELTDPNSLKDILKEKIKTYIVDSENNSDLLIPAEGPLVIMVIGVNGVGKTTTIGKMANKFIKSGRSVMLVAADTFRAAAVSQLQIWGERSNIPVIAHIGGADRQGQE